MLGFIRACLAPLVLVLSLALGAFGALAAERKLVIHVAEGETATMAQAIVISRNVTEHYAKFGDTVDIKILATGGGLDIFRVDRTSYADGLRRLNSEFPKVEFIACGQTLRGVASSMNVPVSEIDLLPNVRVTPVGVAELMDLQDRGYRYVRP